ncbi:hypothetical protein EVAR_4282_1 [Eumeta japonica]|uniref:Uncharacterized protein n=1 Tax=Eumeta variegata TaxID=151549 RepID=A0A4C1VAJ3_EUMVA|nr:hypothetical protein EVAR_4282_1 [Eumeta japonica]
MGDETFNTARSRVTVGGRVAAQLATVALPGTTFFYAGPLLEYRIDRTLGVNFGRFFWLPRFLGEPRGLAIEESRLDGRSYGLTGPGTPVHGGQFECHRLGN